MMNDTLGMAIPVFYLASVAQPKQYAQTDGAFVVSTQSLEALPEPGHTPSASSGPCGCGLIRS